MKPIDLRSDTLTQPTPAMREAMANAEVGDDVFEEDPTLKKLEELAAQKTGKESALFVPSGTMGNLISILSHCQRGDEILLGDRSHIFLHEVGGIAALGGVHPRIIPNNPDGTLLLPLLEHSIRPSDIHNPPTRLICLENTHNFCQGFPLTPDYMDSTRALATKYGLRIHLDGARLFNAAVAQAIDVSDGTEDGRMYLQTKVNGSDVNHITLDAGGVQATNIAKGFCSFNGTGTPALNAGSYNVASLTDNGTGDFDVVWATDFANGDYAVSVSTTEEGGVPAFAMYTQNATTDVRVRVATHAGAFVDQTYNSCIAWGAQ